MEFGDAAGALNCDGGFALEEFVEVVAPGAEGGEDSFDGAAAVEAEVAGFEGGGFFGVGDEGDSVEVEVVEPFFVVVGLGGDEDEVFVGEFEDFAGALFGLGVVVFEPVEGVVGVEGDGGAAGFFVLFGDLGVEEGLRGFADILGEEASGDVFEEGGSGDEEVYAGGALVDGPGVGFGPRTGDRVEGDAGVELLELLVELGGVAVVVVGEMEVVVGEDVGELGADHEDVAMSDEDGFDLGEFG